MVWAAPLALNIDRGYCPGLDLVDYRSVTPRNNIHGIVVHLL